MSDLHNTETDVLEAFDAAAAAHLEAGTGGVSREEPEAEPQPPSHDAFYEVGVDMVRSGELPTGVDLRPGDLGGVDLSDRDAIREALRARQAETTEQSQQRAETDRLAQLGQMRERLDGLEYEVERDTALEEALDAVTAGTATEVWDAADDLRETHPEVLGQFLAEWADVDPEAARTWTSFTGPLPPPPDPQEIAEEFETTMRTAAVARHNADVQEAFTTRLAELAKDPKAARELPAAIEQIRATAAVDPAFMPSTPQEAAHTLDMAVKLSRAHRLEEAGARQVARELAAFDEHLHRQEYMDGLTDVEPRRVTRADHLERITAEQMDPDRVVGRVDAKPAGQAWEDEFFAGWDKRAEGYHRIPEPSETMKAFGERQKAERERRAR